MSETRGRPFAVGNRFGRGRPKGSRNKSTLAAEGWLSQYAEPIMKKCMGEAIQGKPVAMRLCVERILPPRRGVLVQLPLRGTATVAEVDAASQKVVRAISKGQITPEDGETLSRMLEVRARMIEIRDIVPRLEKLEEFERERKQAA